MMHKIIIFLKKLLITVFGISPVTYTVWTIVSPKEITSSLTYLSAGIYLSGEIGTVKLHICLFF